MELLIVPLSLVMLLKDSKIWCMFACMLSIVLYIWFCLSLMSSILSLVLSEVLVVWNGGSFSMEVCSISSKYVWLYASRFVTLMSISVICSFKSASWCWMLLRASRTSSFVILINVYIVYINYIYSCVYIL